MVDYIMPVESRLTGFKYYIEHAEQIFQQRETDLNALIQTSKEKGEDPMEWWADDYWLHTETNLMRMSIFLSLYAFLELILEELCRLQQIEHQLALKSTDLSGLGIERSKNYLKKVVGVDFAFGGKEWNEIKNYQKLRNHFAHQGLRLVKNPEKLTDLEKFIRDHSELHHNFFSESETTFTGDQLKTFEAFKDFEDLPYLPSFLGHDNSRYGGMDMYGDDIEIKGRFCEVVIETIHLFWTQLIQSVQRTHAS
ncbi:MAG: hypothetical protein IPM53_01935 [Anaerolineaceae bacterium]|nr:hypothetical protein [Anaerolineaceae bacterium]